MTENEAIKSLEYAKRILGLPEQGEKWSANRETIAINPALVNSNLPKDTEWEDYMRMAVCMLDMCEVVYFLDGWEKSRGANIEYGYALAKGKDLIFQKEDEAEKSGLENLENWPEVTKGIYKYALTEDVGYEIHLLHQPEGGDLATAKASLYLAGYWKDYNVTEINSYFKRECLLAEATVFECVLESLKDH